MRMHTPDGNRDIDRKISDALLRCAASGNDEQILEALISIDFDWQQLWELAERQHIQPLIAHMLLRPTIVTHLPPDVVQRAKSVRIQWLIRNMASQGELDRIGARFAEYGISVTPLKGTSLSLRLYSDLGARQCGDIDILVPPDQRQRAMQVLDDMGYRPREETKPGVKEHPFHGVPLTRVHGGVGFVVELHWNLSDPRFVPVDAQLLWQRICASNSGVRGLYALPVEELLLFLSTHLPKHDRGLLRLLADIHHLVLNEGSAIDWPYLITLAERWYADDMLYFALSFSQSLLGTPLPDEVLARLAPSYAKIRFVRRLTGPDRILHPPQEEHLRISRFRIAYCAMLRPPRRAVHAYWHYVILPPVDHDSPNSNLITDAIRRPVSGAARTVLALQAAFRCR